MSKLQEIANLAGVSKATVSRVINNSDTVSAIARQKVTEAMNALKLTAQELKRSGDNTKMIGLILPLGKNISSSFCIDILTGAEEKAFEQDYMILIGNSTHIDKERELAMQMANREAEGIIMLSTSGDQNIDHLHFLENSGIPLVLVDQKIEGFSANLVRGDNFLGAMKLMDHLSSLGHQKIVAVAQNDIHSTYRERLRGYQIALIEKGIGLDNKQQIFLGQTDQASNALSDMLSDSRNRPTALFLTDPRLLAVTIPIIEEKHLRIPEDVSIVVFDDSYTQLPEKYKNFFTSVTQSGRLMGSIAVEILYQKLKNPEMGNQEIVIPGVLNIRKSTCSPFSW